MEAPRILTQEQRHPPNKPLVVAPRLNFLLGCSEKDLSSFELARLAEVANLRADLHIILDKIIDEMSQAGMAAWFRQSDRPTLKRAIESEEGSTEEIRAWAKEKIRAQGRNDDELASDLVPRPALVPRATHLARAVRYQERNTAAGLCKVCPNPLDRNSVRYCTKHLAMVRVRERQKKGLSDPGGREYLYAGYISESSQGRQPGTLASLAMGREQKTRALLAELGIPPENAAVSLEASKEAILKCLPNMRGEALTQAQLFENATIPSRTTGQKALKELLSTDRIERTGKGIKSDPYRYFVGGTL